MRDVLVHRREVDEERRTYATAPPDDALVIEGEARLIDADTGDVVAIQARPEMRWAADVARSLRSIRWEGGTGNGSEFRLSGFKNAYRTFGSSSPVPLRRRYGCSICDFNREYPRLTARLEEFARLAVDVLDEGAPDVAKRLREVTDEINPAWRLGGTPWTSGIINKTSALPYHRDAGNVPGAWSAMLGLRRGVTGGALHLAEWGVYLAVPDRSITLFDGQSVLHAVTPFRRESAGAFRYTIVTYAKAGTRKCLAGEAEVHRAQRLRSEAEEREAERLREGGERSLGGHFADRYTHDDAAARAAVEAAEA